ncbi:MAG: EAL domain-containing protein [Sulfurisoma sp.]|nr:EAL domain-containing protein [Sulfurisoma sp.]
MSEVYLVYGLSFLFLGLAIYLQPRSGTYPLEQPLWLLALFGVLHAGREFAEWWLYTHHGEGTAFTHWLSAALLFASYVALVEFGRRLCHLLPLRPPVARRDGWRDVLFYAVLCAGLLFVTLAAADPLRGFTAGARYFFGFSGAILASIGLLRLYRRDRARAFNATLFAPLRLATAGFLLYGLFAGLVVGADPAFPAWLPTREGFAGRFGFPVEVLRALCAVLVTAGISLVLYRLNLESLGRERAALEMVRQLNASLEQRVAERTAELEQTRVSLEGEVAERRATETALRASEARLRSLSEMSSDWFWEQDAELCFTTLSSGIAKGHLKPSSLIGKQRWDMPLDIAPDILAAHRALIEAHRPFRDFEYCVLGEEGPTDWRWFVISGDPLFDEDGRFLGYRGVGEDITARKRAEQALQESEATLNAAQAVAHVGSWVLNLRENRLLWSDESYRIFGIARGTPLTYELFLGCVHPDDRASVDRAWRAAQAGAPYDIEHRIVADGAVRWVREKADLRFDAQGQLLSGVGTVQDITQSKGAEAQLHLLASVFRHSGEALLITDADNIIIEVNPSFTRLTGYTADEARGKNPRLLASGNTSPEQYAAMWRSIREQGFWLGEIWDRRKDGSVYPKLLNISVVRDAAGAITHHIAAFADISAQKAAEEKIRHLAHHDALTGLPNRFTLEGRLEQALATARRDGERLAVMFIDLDRFKVINDTLGHHIGDGLLIEVASRLRQSVRESDVVARLGGDEFIIVLTGGGAELAAAHVAEKILASVSLPCHIDGHALHTTSSIGIAVFPADGDSVETLMKSADIAMYHAKAQGRDNYQFFTGEMTRAAAEQLLLENNLHVAIRERQFLLHYQPQIDMRDGRVIGVEALVRWQHPTEGMIPPLRFIPIAEDTGLIVPLGEWILDEACRCARAWREQGIAGVRMAINISAHQLRQPDFVARVARALGEHGLTGADIELELTESLAMRDPAATIEILKALRDMGVMLAIDDFGTGYSSLSYLKLLPIHRLKLDRSFVMDIETDPNDAAICAATIALAHNLGFKVVAEGIETERQHDYLRRLGCDYGQGYLFSRPLAETEATVFVGRGASRAGRY